MMEAARILKAIGVKPRRTIRVALWSGEEEGLLGSQAYVKEHFGSFESPKPEYAKLVAYLNIDSGTGRARGAGVFGPPAAAAIAARRRSRRSQDLGVVGASATRSRAVGGTDSTSFNNAGLPGIGFGQDPIEYNTHTHHTNLDTYERIIEDDVKDVGDRRSRRRSTSSRCATRCCRASRRPTCRRRCHGIRQRSEESHADELASLRVSTLRVTARLAES